jgi:hypothetical protein
MRPKKTTVDYFPHKTNSGKTISILENLYGNDGYAAWFKILELLGATSGHYYDFNSSFGLQFLAAKIGVSIDTTKEILNTLAELEAIDSGLHAKGIIWSQNFVDGLAPLYSKREGGVPGIPDVKKNTPGIPDTDTGNSRSRRVSGSETRVSGVRNTQRKGKETKGKERKDNLKIIRRAGFKSFDLSTVDERLTIEILEAFIDHRAKIKKPITPYALKLACNDAVKVFNQYGVPPDEAINHIIAMGWQGCNPRYFENYRTSSKSPQRRQGTPRQNYMEAVGNLLEQIDGITDPGSTGLIVQAPQSLPRGGA